VPAGASTTILVQYYVPNPRSIPNPVLIATPLPFSNPAATPQLTRISPVANDLLRIEFTAQSGRFYFIQYSEDFARWVTDSAPVKAASSTAHTLQINRGGTRFYRLMLAP
jgi:hypothetical protein